MTANNPYRNIIESQKPELTKARRAMQEAYLKLSREKAFSDISVKRLCETAQVARSTFYANYMNTDDLLAEIEDALICDLLKVNEDMCSIRSRQESTNKYNENMMRFIREHHRELHILLIEQPDNRLINKWKVAVKFHFFEILTKEEQENSGFVLEILASMAVGAYTWLLDHPDEFNPEQVSRILQNSIRALEY